MDVRLCGSGSPQSTTAKRGHFVGHHGESVTQSVPPNLCRGVRLEVDVRHKGRGLKRGVFGQMSHHIAGGWKGRKRHAERAAEPARIEELPARVEYIAKDLSRNEQTFARMVRIP